MEDIPQPSRDSYSVGDRVQIYIGSDDPDSQYHGVVCKVIEIHIDDLNLETDRATDAYSYILRDVKTDEELPIPFRHQDLVEIDDTK